MKITTLLCRSWKINCIQFSCVSGMPLRVHYPKKVSHLTLRLSVASWKEHHGKHQHLWLLQKSVTAPSLSPFDGKVLWLSTLQLAAALLHSMRTWAHLCRIQGSGFRSDSPLADQASQSLMKRFISSAPWSLHQFPTQFEGDVNGETANPLFGAPCAFPFQALVRVSRHLRCISTPVSKQQEV